MELKTHNNLAYNESNFIHKNIMSSNFSYRRQKTQVIGKFLKVFKHFLLYFYIFICFQRIHKCSLECWRKKTFLEKFRWSTSIEQQRQSRKGRELRFLINVTASKQQNTMFNICYTLLASINQTKFLTVLKLSSEIFQ